MSGRLTFRYTYPLREGEVSVHSTVCVVCGQQVTDNDARESNVHPSRIGGESDNGYQLSHIECLS